MAKKVSVFGNLRQFDGYAKTLDDFRVKTTTGASGTSTSSIHLALLTQQYNIFLVTIISTLVIIILICSELIAYTTSTWRPSLVVDKSRKEKMPINFNITFPHMPCHSKSFSNGRENMQRKLSLFVKIVTNIDIMDDTGAHSSGYSQDVIKVRLDSNGVPIELGEPVSK
jgi:hypothetical protein